MNGFVGYKGHTIIQSDFRVADDQVSGYSQRHRGKPLYAVQGRFIKPAPVRPFITSIADAKRWLNEQLTAAEIT